MLSWPVAHESPWNSPSPLSTAKSGESSGAAAKRRRRYRVLKEKHCPKQLPEGADSPAHPASAPRPGWLQASSAETSLELADQEEPRLAADSADWLDCPIARALVKPRSPRGPVLCGPPSHPSPHLPTLLL